PCHMTSVLYLYSTATRSPAIYTLSLHDALPISKYEQARQQDGENARSTQRLAMEYNKQADSLNRMEHQLANYTKELNEMRVKSSSWYKMGDAMQGFGDKLGGISQKAR